MDEKKIIYNVCVQIFAYAHIRVANSALFVSSW